MESRQIQSISCPVPQNLRFVSNTTTNTNTTIPMSLLGEPGHHLDRRHLIWLLKRSKVLLSLGLLMMGSPICSILIRAPSALLSFIKSKGDSCVIACSSRGLSGLDTQFLVLKWSVRVSWVKAILTTAKWEISYRWIAALSAFAVQAHIHSWAGTWLGFLKRLQGDL